MTTLSKEERAWVKKVNDLLAKCPSKRLGFYTIGDAYVEIYDRTLEDEINDQMDSGKAGDFCIAVQHVDAALGTLNFPAAVHSTAG
ncbi:hypothetical protein EH206_09660 [Brenneria nigrifluens DSM 30175 = ATCC 13028]|uniref:Uncharacterized protein n=2 Tax=Pectobacteriaceae TaxID=1903410 RepID=A0A2U1UIP5_9GAMM|nr:hypothetical protein DDT54_18850 [Brenneria nigrifluens DSM 30175 = ATCC 13028]QCR06892.1 hypothetical protein EH206_09660 [Brenneria nigrifluens DSM 30175 = ATCC 13028]